MKSKAIGIYLSAIFSTCFLISTSALSAEAKVIKMKYDTCMSETWSGEQLNTWLLDYVEKKSNGRIKISRFYSQALHKIPEILPAVRSGVSELGLIAYGYYPADFPISRGTEWYYRGCNHADTMLYLMRDLYNQFEPFRKEWEKTNNLKVIYFLNWEYCPYFMTKPMPTLAEIKGRKIRAYGIGSDTVERLGATGVPIVAPEITSALERGILDGVFATSFITMVNTSCNKPAPYIIQSGAGVHAPTAVCMNMDLWKSLDPELKAIFEAGVKKMYDHVYLDIYAKMIAEAVDKAVKDGSKFSTWSAEDMTKAKAMVQPAQINAWIDKVCPLDKSQCEEMQALITKLIAKYEPNAKLKLPYQVYLEKYGK